MKKVLKAIMSSAALVANSSAALPSASQGQMQSTQHTPYYYEPETTNLEAVGKLAGFLAGVVLFLLYDSTDALPAPAPVKEAPAELVRKVQETFRSKKAPIVADLADFLIDTLQLTVIEGGVLLAYDGELGCFCILQKPELIISRYLDPKIDHLMLEKDVKDIISRIKRTKRCQRSIDTFNNQPEKVCMLDGVYDFEKQTIEPHSIEQRFTYIINAHIISDRSQVSTPVFDRFCQTSLGPAFSLGDEEDQRIIASKRKLLLTILGNLFCDSIGAKTIFFFLGESNSGKSQMLMLFKKYFPPELMSAVQLHELGGRFERAELLGKKVNIVGEIAGKPLRDLAIAKSVSNSDDIEAQFKGDPLFHFTPTVKLLFAGNTIPISAEADPAGAFANRMVVLKFNRSIPKEEQDKHLLDKLWEERDSIFTLAMDALRELHENDYNFEQPEESLEYINYYRERCNPPMLFLKELCELGAEYRVHKTPLYEVYVRFCTENALTIYTRSGFFQVLSGVPGIRSSKFRMNGKNCHGLIGIRLKQRAEKAKNAET